MFSCFSFVVWDLEFVRSNVFLFRFGYCNGWERFRTKTRVCIECCLTVKVFKNCSKFFLLFLLLFFFVFSHFEAFAQFLRRYFCKYTNCDSHIFHVESNIKENSCNQIRNKLSPTGENSNAKLGSLTEACVWDRARENER